MGKRKKVQIYKTLVKTVLTYNYGTWGLTKKDTETLTELYSQKTAEEIIERSLEVK